MLRITLIDSPIEQRWILQGRLEAPWVAELETSWKDRSRQEMRTCVVDLTEVTLIDKRGEKMLKAMRKVGADLIARGVYLRHVVDDINRQCLLEGNVQPFPRGKKFHPALGPAPVKRRRGRSR